MASCSETVVGLDESAPLQTFTNFVSSAYAFASLGPGATVYDAGVVRSLICATPPQPRPSMGINKSADSNGIRLYPNPARNTLHISGLPGMGSSQITLRDMQGRIVLSTQQEGKEASLDVSSLESGVYFLKVSTVGGKVFVEKAIVR